MFELFGAEDASVGQRIRLLRSDVAGQRLSVAEPSGNLVLTAPYEGIRLDIPAPIGFEIAVVSPHPLGIRHPPLEPYDCEDGECEPPDDPTDECSDGIDNDGNGVVDGCDWNCLPHRDYGADAFPQARSRIEGGKTYAMLGAGSICSTFQGAWMATFADWGLQASEIFDNVRPENDRIHYRSFSCWVFADGLEAHACQYGVWEEKMEEVPPGACSIDWISGSVCPPGFEDYPYRPTATEDALADSDQDEYCRDRTIHHMDELKARIWTNFATNTLTLGPAGEPTNGGHLSDRAMGGDVRRG